MTPAQEAKEYAEKHGFEIRITARRRYEVSRDGKIIADVWGYPIALAVMQKFVGEHAKDADEAIHIDCIDKMVRGAVITDWPVKSADDIIQDTRDMIVRLTMDHYRQTNRGLAEEAKRGVFNVGIYGVTPQEWAEHNSRPRYAFTFESPDLRKPKSWPNRPYWAVRFTNFGGLTWFDQPVSNRKDGVRVIRSVYNYWLRRGEKCPQMSIVYVGGQQ